MSFFLMFISHSRIPNFSDYAWREAIRRNFLSISMTCLLQASARFAVSSRYVIYVWPSWILMYMILWFNTPQITLQRSSSLQRNSLYSFLSSNPSIPIHGCITTSDTACVFVGDGNYGLHTHTWRWFRDNLVYHEFWVMVAPKYLFPQSLVVPAFQQDSILL